MSAAAKRAIIAVTIALGLATSAQGQPSSSSIRHYRHRQPVQRDFGAGIYRRQLYNYSPPYNYDPGYPASDTAAALDE
jgi:hypothetical protein